MHMHTQSTVGIPVELGSKAVAVRLTAFYKQTA